MKAFDTDVVTEILSGNPAYLERIAQVPPHEQAMPIVVAEEILRGRLNVIRQAEAANARVSIDRAYQLLESTLVDFRDAHILSYTPAAESQFKYWRNQKIKGSTHDLRIAACCLAHSATLVTRNRRNFEKIPGLAVEVWG